MNNGKPRVFIPQEPSRFDTALGRTVPYVDLTPALEYGDLVVCLPPGVNFINTAPLVYTMREKMASFTSEDFLVAVGDPTGIAIAAAIAAKMANGKFNLLKWDRRTRKYQLIAVIL